MATPESEPPPPHPEEVRLLDELSAWLPEDEAAAESLPAATPGAFAARTASLALYRSERLGSSDHRRFVESLPYGKAIYETAHRYELDSLLIAAVVETESGFNAEAVSPRGARGLMQLMPATASSLGAADPIDPHGNLDAGTRYLESLLDRYDGDLGLSLAAYNAGPANVARYGGVPPFPETTRYVRKVIRLYLEHHRSVGQRLGPPRNALGRPLPSRATDLEPAAAVTLYSAFGTRASAGR